MRFPQLALARSRRYVRQQTLREAGNLVLPDALVDFYGKQFERLAELGNRSDNFLAFVERMEARRETHA